MKPGIYFDISNEDYHAGDGVSKSQLDMVALSPALLQWQKSAPVDTEKPEQKQEEKPKSSDDRDPEEILCAFTDAAMNYNTLKDLDNAYKYVAKKLAADDERLAKATDVYTIRRDELNEVPM